MSLEEIPSDAALMQGFARGENPRALELYRRFAPRIYGLGRVMLGESAAAQDLVQDTFVKVWRNAARFDPERGRLETWILLIARGLAVDALRRRVLESRANRTMFEAVPAAAEPGPEELSEIHDLSSRARRAMATLPPEQRSALELAYFGGRTGAEIAELEGIPLGTAKTRVRTALLRLRDELAGEVAT